MGKLLKHQIEKHLKTNWFLPLFPILVLIFNKIYFMFSLEFSERVFAYSMFFIVMTSAAAIITIVVGDYNMFFDKEALFYEAIPIKPGAKTVSRVLYYFIMILIYTVLITFCVLMLLYNQVIKINPEILSVFNRFKEEVIRLFINSDAMDIVNIILFCIVNIIHSISKIMFSINYGSEKSLNKLGFGAVIIVYIALSIIEAFGMYSLANSNILDGFEASISLSNSSIVVDGGGIIFILIMLLCSLILLYLVNYSHKKRISVN